VYEAVNKVDACFLGVFTVKVAKFHVVATSCLSVCLSACSICRKTR
jgi:hypothetical protein